ncbi:MAG: FkbM family methyltransferase [Pseudomonadota bacterium]
MFSDNLDYPSIDEDALLAAVLPRLAATGNRQLVQVGANEGKFEYAKPDGKDFIFEFLQDNSDWRAILIEPIPDIFDKLVENYRDHSNQIFYLNCAITEGVETRDLMVVGRDGKSSTLIEGFRDDRAKDKIRVNCLPLRMACDLCNMQAPAFLKVDAERYDEIIVEQLFTQFDPQDRPALVLWEQMPRETRGLSKRFIEDGYTVFRTGQNSRGRWMDLVAVKSELLPDT